MAKPITFLDRVEQSGLVEQDQLIALLRDLKLEAARDARPLTDEAIAARLVQRGHLTPWHCDQMFRGRHRGFVLGKYRLLDALGGGGMSKVYLAEHTLMRRRVAIKVLPKNFVEQPAYRERFHYEARAAAALDHRNIVRAYDFDDHSGPLPYLVMEYVEGQNLQEMVEEDGPLDYAMAVEYIRQAAEALAHAHEARLVHRDIKPANLMVDRKNVVKLLDLGLALSEQEKRELAGNAGETVKGTMDYLPPEQAENSDAVDARADIYGLGASLYFLLTGHPPFTGADQKQRLRAIKHQQPPSIYEDRPDAPADLVDICARMMAKHPADRYASAREVAAVLESWLAAHGQGDTPGDGSSGGPPSGGLAVAVSAPHSEFGGPGSTPPVVRRAPLRRPATKDTSPITRSLAETPQEPLTLTGVAPCVSRAIVTRGPPPAPPRRERHPVTAVTRKALPVAQPIDDAGEFIWGDLLGGSGGAALPKSPVAAAMHPPRSKNHARLPWWTWPAIGGGFLLGLAMVGFLIYTALR